MSAIIQSKVSERLSNLWVDDGIIRSYFLDMGNQPYVVLKARHGKGKPVDWCAPFVEAARKLIFDVLREVVLDASKSLR